MLATRRTEKTDDAVCFAMCTCLGYVLLGERFDCRCFITFHHVYQVGLIPVNCQEDLMNNEAKCRTLLGDALSSYSSSYDTTGAIQDLITTIATQYTEYPSGPYVYCYGGIRKGQENSLEMVRFVHPYLELNETIAQTLDGMNKTSGLLYADSYQNASLKALDDCCGDLFNFTVNFNQPLSEESPNSQVVAGPLRDYLGFGESLGDEYFLCACPITNVPAGDRRNDNAAVLLNQSNEKPAATASAFAQSTLSYLYTIFSALLLISVWIEPMWI